MKVYVISKTGKPIMPTTPARARKMLRDRKAKVVKRTPFTIQMIVATKEYIQPIILGVDAGSKIVGISAVTDNEEIYSSEAILRNDIVELLSEKRQYRRTKRNRLRYRKVRFLNRKKDKGWIAPSITHKIDSHLKIISNVYKILPISKIIVEVASFDIQKIKNPKIDSIGYQQGEQLGFWNIREYVLWRDEHKCQAKKSCKNKILNVHHIESRKTGGDSPSNLITLCEECHTAYHAGKLNLNLKRGKTFKDATFMGIIRWAFYNRLKDIYENVDLTYGYITKNTRITNNLPKEHRIDALCITGKPRVKKASTWYQQKFVRKNNRSLHKANLLKGSIRKANKAPYLVKGFRLFDKVIFENTECFIFGRRSTGYFDLRLLDGTKIHASASYKKLRLLEMSKTILTEVNGDSSTPLKGSGFLA